ncbi:MAG: methionyl-tRNA formyltransferase [Ruminococcaceae bacterium]|nr:methionyl-tRNA formyltransferase [Oscillospiraceae bacterium]
MRIVFMGTPDFAVPTLKALISAGHSVVGVFTQPDKPVGRKQILTPPPVKVEAEKNGIRVFQPTTLRDGAAYEILKELNPEIIVVVAYGKILPKEILDLPKYKCVNGHASLLPRHRGASPIQWSIVCGDKVTGVTTMLMDEGMDTGDMLETVTTEISDTDTAETLHDRLSILGAELMCSTLEKIEKGSITPKPQGENGVTYAPIIKKEMGILDFSKNAKELHCLIRAFSGWPVAYFSLNGKRVKVYSAEVAVGDGSVATVLSSKNEFVVSCGENTALKLTRLQIEGSKPMDAKAFLCGNAIPVGTKL